VLQKWQAACADVDVFLQVTGALYLCSSIVLLILWASIGTYKTSASVAAAALEFVASITVVFLSRYEHTRAVRPSHLLQFLLLVLLCCDAVRLRTLYLVHYPPSLLAASSAHIFLTGCMLLTESLNKRRLLKGDDDKGLSPEETVGLFAEKLFWYLNGLFRTGLSHGCAGLGELGLTNLRIPQDSHSPRSPQHRSGAGLG
jgi:ATP-binding cassette, subfamily C (CFTR/MRP), member 1